MHKKFILVILSAALFSACSDDDTVTSTSPSTENPPLTPDKTCGETGEYACKTGETESLYPFQWALNYKNSFFKKFPNIWKNPSDPEDYDLKVETLHKQGIKGQGVNVIVLDDGIDIQHEDLAPNINKNMTFNFLNQTNDPTPEDDELNILTAHGTHVAGIIGAAQNGKGVMGIAPRVNLGGALYLSAEIEENYDIAALGGAEFSKNADIFNGSFGSNPEEPNSYDTNTTNLTSIRALPNLRNKKGAIFLKASGNEFVYSDARTCPIQFQNLLSCENPAHDYQALEPTMIVVAAANTRGIKASYSNAGPINWITGLGGESGQNGDYGEGDPNTNNINQGPSIFSTDLQGCSRGYSSKFITPGDGLLYSTFLQGSTIYNNAKNNLFCNYGYLNGTSAATPTLSGVTALILQANPDLTWRDVREILRASARAIDPNYVSRIKSNRLVNLTTGQILEETGINDIQDGMTKVPLEFGWQTNAAGHKYSNWYGFGLVNAEAAVQLAKNYKAGTLQAQLKIPDFISAFPDIEEISYGKVTKLGTISLNKNEIIDQFQLRISGPICVGSVGLFVKSPSGVISTLSIPYNIYYKSGVSKVDHFGLGSYAFHDEKATGEWQVFAVSGDKGICQANVSASNPLKVEYRIIPKLYS